MSESAPATVPTATQAAAPANTGEGAQQQKAEQQATAADQQPKAVDDELDFGDFKLKKSEAAERLKRQRELERGSYKKFEEAAQLRKEADAIFGSLKTQTKEALLKAGITKQDLVKLAEEVLTEEMTELNMSPIEKRARQLEAENEMFRQQREHEERQRMESAQAAEVQQWESKFDQAFQDVIARKGLDADADTIFKLASKVEAYWGNGHDISLDEIADEIAEEEEEKWGRRLQSWDDAKLAKRLGDKGKDRVRKLLLEDLKQQQTKPPPAQQQARASQSPRQLTRAEFEARVAQRLKGKL